MRTLDPTGWHYLSAEDKERCRWWLARHGIEMEDTSHYTEVRPGEFHVRGYRRNDDGRFYAVDGEPARWERTVIDECPPPFLTPPASR